MFGRSIGVVCVFVFVLGYLRSSWALIAVGFALLLASSAIERRHWRRRSRLPG